MRHKILVVDDDPYFNKILTSLLKKNNFDVKSCFTSKSAMEIMASQTFDLVLIDYKLPDIDGLELMKKIKSKSPDQLMILITNYSDIRTAVKSIQNGAFEFVTKPVIPDELLATINAALRQTIESDKKKHTQSKQLEDLDKKYIIGKSKSSRQVWEQLHLVAPTKMSVMIVGESGTGKEYAARIIHENSKRKTKPFISVDCGALTKELAISELFGHVKGAFTGALNDKKGQFELANGGTLFLDEVGNLSYDVQMQLLRTLQEQKIRRLGSEYDISIDVRVISATNEQMANAIEIQKFRLDLFHRLNEFELNICPLRDRLEDLDEYIQLFLQQANNELEKSVEGFDKEVFEIFQKYPWFGNLRELRNIVRRSVLVCQGNKVGISQIPEALLEENTYQNSISSANEPKIPLSNDLKQLQEQQEKEAIERTLIKTKYNKSKAASILNIDRTTLYNKISKYKIDV